MTTENWGVGNKADSKAFATTKVGEETVELIHGEHPHSRRDNTTYARFPSGNIEGFSGHRLLHEITFEDYNYLKDSWLSGSEVRPAGMCKIKINGFLCEEFFYRDVKEALVRARQRLSDIHDHSIRIWDEEERKKLVGRKIYYREVPAVITNFIDSQACVIIKTESGEPFPPTPYKIEEGEDDSEDSVKETIYSPYIWWWRK